MAAKNQKADAGTLRLLDANLNRAREGIRVVEDAARFVFDDKPRYERLRALRHELHAITKGSYKSLIASRESGADVGRKISEKKRASSESVLSANFRRAQEAVRVLEEYSKVFSPRAAGAFKQVRYQLYQEEKFFLGMK